MYSIKCSSFPGPNSEIIKNFLWRNATHFDYYTSLGRRRGRLWVNERASSGTAPTVVSNEIHPLNEYVVFSACGYLLLNL